MIRKSVIAVLQGIAIGVANVIPGVSGGTIALIIGIFERLINSIKSFDVKAFGLLAKGKFSDFAKYTDIGFLMLILTGVAIAIISAAKILDVLFKSYPEQTWSFFFGLILASVFYVGRTITSRKWPVFIFGALGAFLAVSITLMSPAVQNEGFLYLMVCGAVAMCSMILPGLSGSFVLLILGNYQLVVIEAVNEWRFDVLIPFAIGAASGILAFSHFLSWVLRKYRNQTIAILTGFIAGSLGVLWPWKQSITQTYGLNEKVIGYQYHLPEINTGFFISLLFILIGIMIIVLMEHKVSPSGRV